MDTLTGLAAGGVLATVAGWALAGARRMARERAQARQAPVLIDSAMSRLGITPADADAVGMRQDLEQAAARCANCAQATACRSRLSSLLPRRPPAECPNARVFAVIAWHRRERERVFAHERACQLGYLVTPRLF